jgi:nucleotide-binding universal stress UspA family protein
MAIKTVLTVVGLQSGDRDLKLAVRICEEVGAHLSVLIMGIALPAPIADPYSATISDVWLQQRRDDLKQLEVRTAEVSSFLAASAVSADVSSEYPEQGSADNVVGRRAQYADLTLLGPGALHAGDVGEKAIEGALFASGKPLLLAPEGTSPSLKPKRVLVAWNSGVEAARAVRESLDMLAGAETVRVVLVDPVESESRQGAEPGADVAAFLARHGVKVSVDRLPSGGRSVADALRRHAVDTACDMIVMGAYGHSRLRERIFGGTTQSMLEKPTVPVLLAR